MIYRKWSLLTGPPVILGAIVGAVVVSTLIFDPFGKTPAKKQEPGSSTK